jgi:arylsulfatase A-like enzyme
VIEGPFASAASSTLAALAARYDECIRELDSAIAGLLEELERREVLERTWVFVTSDHGEAFLEHGVTSHGTGLHNEQVRIPLIVIPPRGSSLAASDSPVDLLDVAATVAAIGGRARFGHGRDLRGPHLAARAIGMQSFGHPRPSAAATLGEGAREWKRAVVVDGFKLIERGQTLELYDLSADPAERENRARSDPVGLAALGAQLPPLITHLPPPGEVEVLTVRERETLRALGYIE